MNAVHGIPPVWSSSSRILILGSFPSVRSREDGFFYAHPQNRFWRVLSALFGCALPETVSEKKEMLLSRGAALWDVVASCDISGSSDSSIRSAAPNDIPGLIAGSDVRAIFLNGQTAAKLFEKHFSIDLPRFALPSTSPANAAYSLERLIESWNAILRYLSPAGAPK